MWREGATFPGKRILKIGTLYTDVRPKWVSAQEGADQKKAMS
jgi:hypothetical protein